MSPPPAAARTSPSPGDAAPRPGAWVYGLAKDLGEESLRLLTEKHRFQVAALRFWSVKRADTPRSDAGGLFA